MVAGKVIAIIKLTEYMKSKFASIRDSVN